MTLDTLKEIGRVDELGSGVRNSFKYCGIYTQGTIPTFNDDDIFRAIIPLIKPEGTTQKTTQEKVFELLIESPTVSRKKLAEILGNISEDGVKYHIDKLKKEGEIERIGSDKGGYWKVNQ